MALPGGISKTAMVLAAGLGTRMRPLSDRRPKCLLEVGGRAIIDHALDRLIAAGIVRVIVNLHYKGDMIREHLAARHGVELIFSDEGEAILDTGGGVKNVLGELGSAPFYVVNGISLWFDGGTDTLGRLADAYDADAMDVLLLLQAVETAKGYDGKGDFRRAADGRLSRRPDPGSAPYVYTGVQILAPQVFDDSPDGAFSLNLLYDRAQAKGRLFGQPHRGRWMNLKTPEALAAARRALGE